MSWDIIIIVLLVVTVGFLAFTYVMNTLINPHKLDSIRTLIENQKYEQAISALNALLKRDDKNPEAHLYLAEACYLSGNFEMALVEYKQALTSGKFSNKPQEKSIHRRLADIYLRFNQLEEAQKEYLVLSQMEPQNAEYLFQIGNIFYQRGMKEHAFSYLDRAIKSGKASPQIYFIMGKILYEMNKAAEALNYFTNCVKLEPRNMEAHYYIGMILKSMNSYGKAVQEFDVAEQAKDNQLKIKAIFQKGLCKMEGGDNEGAKADFERALKYATEENNVTIAVRYTLGLLYEKERRLVEAVEQWEKVAQLRPNFQDVQTKLALYEDLRVDDRLKDLLTATPTTFEIIAQNMLKAIGYEPLELKALDGDNLEIVCIEKSVKWRNVRGGRVLVVFSRDTEDVPEDVVAKLTEKMKSIHATRGVYITTGKFAPQALRYAENRPLDLYDRQKLTEILKKSGY